MESHPQPYRLKPLLAVVAALFSAAALAAPEAPAKKPAAKPAAAEKKSTARKAKDKPQKKSQAKTAKPKDGKATAKKDLGPGPLADFGNANASADVRHIANWVSYTRNNQKKAFVVIDKKSARMFVFDPNGKLRSDAPVLLGKAVGDHTAPGVGNKPLSQLKEEEKTTPAGRFLARPGRNLHTDVIWIDYNNAVSLHRVLKVGNEQRFERLATADVGDNRVSNGCVNVPIPFYNGVLRPTVMKHGAYVYVLPDSKTPQQLFGSYDVPRGTQLAQAAPATGK